MTMKAKLRKIVLGCAVIAAAVVVDGWLRDGAAISSVFIDDAQARVGRPLSPGSVAGIARRTTRRAIRRSTIYIVTLPQSCVTVIIDETTLYLCGTTYYQHYHSQYVVVYVN